AFSSYAHSLGLRTLALENERVFKFIKALGGAPLLPCDLIWRGVLQIWDEVERSPWSNQLRPLFEYFEREWKPRVDELSVFDCPERSNNCSESDNHALASLIPQNRPNCFHLIGSFVKLEHLAWCDKSAIDDGRQVTVMQGLRMKRVADDSSDSDSE
ncbi:Magnesium-protoporphyrin IX monomethyl ester [oxidative] cyclase 2, chloroplastic, partial [Frankliniella fusca]